MLHLCRQVVKLYIDHDCLKKRASYDHSDVGAQKADGSLKDDITREAAILITIRADLWQPRFDRNYNMALGLASSILHSQFVRQITQEQWIFRFKHEYGDTIILKRLRC